jgi:hypothetical protein
LLLNAIISVFGQKVATFLRENLRFVEDLREYAPLGPQHSRKRLQSGNAGLADTTSSILQIQPSIWSVPFVGARAWVVSAGVTLHRRRRPHAITTDTDNKEGQE